MKLPYRALVSASLFAAPLITVVGAADVVKVAGRPRATTPPGAAFRPGEVIVQFKESVAGDRGRVERALKEGRVESARAGFVSGRYLASLIPGDSVAEAVSRLRAIPEVDFAEPNGIVRKSQASTFVPNDTFYRFQWNLKLLGAERTWAIQKGKPEVVVAVLDTGIAYEDFGPYRKAPDFAGTVFVPGFDFVNDDAHANDDEYHGTHVASTIAEATNNGVGRGGSRLRLRPHAGEGAGRGRRRDLLRRGRGHRVRHRLPQGRTKPGQGHQPEPGRPTLYRVGATARSTGRSRAGWSWWRPPATTAKVRSRSPPPTPRSSPWAASTAARSGPPTPTSAGS